LRGVKLKERLETAEMNFDVNAKLEEKERKSGKRVIGFVLTVGTKPSVAKFEVEGLATLEGKNPDIDKMLEVTTERKIPLLLNRVYQSVFTSTYLLAQIMDTSYPPPDMLSSGEMNKNGSEGHVEWGGKEEANEAEKPEQTKKVKAKAKR
jgi:hypothetical protein